MVVLPAESRTVTLILTAILLPFWRARFAALRAVFESFNLSLALLPLVIGSDALLSLNRLAAATSGALRLPLAVAVQSSVGQATTT